MSLRWRLAQVAFYVNRFSALARAERLFDGVGPGTFVERRLFGHRFVCDIGRSGPQKLLYLLGERYVAEADLIRSLVKPGMRIVDVGANIGYYVLLFAQLVGQTGTIVAVEPSPENLPELELNVVRNKLRNVQIVAQAVGAEKKQVGLLSGINSGVSMDRQTPFIVEQELIDNIATERVDLLKIDIEGYESQALLGAISVLSRERPIIFLEVHPKQLVQYGSSVAEIIETLYRYYEKIIIFEPSQPSGLLGKAIRYYARRGVKRIADIGTYVERCLDGNVLQPFWIICHL